MGSACLWSQVPAFADPITMEMILQEIMHTHNEIVNYHLGPILQHKTELTLDDLHSVGVYERAEAVLQEWNDRLEAWDNDPLTRIPTTQGGHPRRTLSDSLSQASTAIYDLYCKACWDIRAPQGWSTSRGH
jgi:hypothetical protein